MNENPTLNQCDVNMLGNNFDTSLVYMVVLRLVASVALSLILVHDIITKISCFLILMYIYTFIKEYLLLIIKHSLVYTI